MSVYTSWTSDDAVAAFKSLVTEIAFVVLEKGASEEAKATVVESLQIIGADVTTVGKASGNAIGWGELKTIQF
jgi:hypothetical protein